MPLDLSRRNDAPDSPARRRFFKVAAATSGGLVIALALPWLPRHGIAAESGVPAEPDAFLRIDPDNSVTVIVKHLEMGQGVATGLATIVADELDADWSQLKVAFAPAEVPRYANRMFGIQGTGGSTSINNSWDELRHAGAVARLMLVGAAAAQWSVPAGEITVEKGTVRHAGSGRQASFGDLAAKAAAQPLPQQVTLKDPKNFALIGSPAPRRLDSPEKTDGKAKFGLDLRRPDMLRAMIARPPCFGGKLKSMDATAAKAVKGVVAVLEVPSGVAVLATDTWAARRGRDALKCDWDLSSAETRSTDAILAEYKTLAGKPGAVAANRGDSQGAMKKAARVIEADYSFPYLAHAPMEPLNALVELTPDGADLSAGFQFHTIDHQVAAKALQMDPAKVRLHTVWAGGSFGRRANSVADYVGEAAAVARAYAATNGGKATVQLVWAREDDIKGGRYRPMFYHRLRAGLDAQGKLIAWEHRLVGQSIMAGGPFETVMVKDGVDGTSVEGAADMPYGVPNLRVELQSPRSPVPVLWWRSVGHTHTAYAVESFLDEAAAAGGHDPLAFRLALLASQPKQTAVLKLAAEKAGWGTPLPKGRGRGLALHDSFGSTVAEVAEVTVGSDGRIKVDRVVVAVDCGTAVNPDQVAAQMEGGLGFGLGAILRNAITLKDGQVEQSNFPDYEPLRINDMPRVEVHIVPSTAHPTGVGEPGVPPIGPAVANAIFAATGKRIRDLPFAKAGLV